MAEDQDIVAGKGINAPVLTEEFPSVRAQYAGMSPENHALAPQSFQRPAYVWGEQTEDTAKGHNFLVLGGMREFEGNIGSLREDQKYIGIQEAITEHTSYSLGLDFNNPYGGKTTSLMLNYETHSFMKSDAVTVGAGLGVEHGLKEHVDKDALLFGSVVPKAEVYTSVRLSNSDENILPKGTNLKIGVESVPEPSGDFGAAAFAQIRIPWSFK